MIKTFKTVFKTKLQNKLHIISELKANENLEFQDVVKIITIFDSMCLLCDSWADVKTETIRNCFDLSFKNALIDETYVNSETTKSEIENELHVPCYDEYLCDDFEKDEFYIEEINTEESEKLEEEYEGELEIDKIYTTADMLHHLKEMKKWKRW